VSRVPGEAHFVPEVRKLTTGHGYMDKNAQKLLPPELLLLAQICTKNRSLAGAPPHTPLEELTALPRPLAGLRGGPPRKGKEGGEEKGGEGGEGRGGSPGMLKSRVGKPMSVCR